MAETTMYLARGTVFQLVYGGELYLGYVFTVVLQEMRAHPDLIGYLFHGFEFRFAGYL